MSKKDKAKSWTWGANEQKLKDYFRKNGSKYKYNYVQPGTKPV